MSCLWAFVTSSGESPSFTELFAAPIPDHHPELTGVIGLFERIPESAQALLNPRQRLEHQRLLGLLLQRVAETGRLPTHGDAKPEAGSDMLVADPEEL